MNKKIIAAAIAAAMLAPVAQADVKITGRIGGDLASYSTGIMFGEFGQSRVQFDFTDGDLVARMALDMRVGRSGVGQHRDAYIGVKLGDGTLAFGRMAGAVKGLEGDKYAATFLEMRNGGIEGGSYGSSSFINGLVGYKMKSGDMNFNVQYAPAINSDAEGHIGLGVKGKAGDIGYWVGYNNGDTVSGSGTAVTKAGVSMKFGDITAKLGYDQVDAPGVDAHMFVGAEMGLGDGMTADLTYATLGEDGVDPYIRVAVMKKMGDKSSIYAGYVSNGGTNVVPGTAEGVFGLGAIVKF